MLTPRLTNCRDCADIPNLVKKIDCKLSELGVDMYNNITYLLGNPIPNELMSQLIAYRRILIFKYCNNDYACKTSINDIANKVIRLTNGCKTKCVDQPILSCDFTGELECIYLCEFTGVSECLYDCDFTGSIECLDCDNITGTITCLTDCDFTIIVEVVEGCEFSGEVTCVQPCEFSGDIACIQA